VEGSALLVSVSLERKETFVRAFPGLVVRLLEGRL
jgi:hypothetical protein